MNITTDEREDPTFPEQCRTCGGKIDDGEGVFNDDGEGAAYYHETCFTN